MTHVTCSIIALDIALLKAMRHLCFISMVGTFGQSTLVDNSDCSVCLLSRKNLCFFKNTRTRSYLTLHFFLLLLEYDTDFRRVFPIHLRLAMYSYQCCYPPTNKSHECCHIVLCVSPIFGFSSIHAPI